jgi:hypothetical protein
LKQAMASRFGFRFSTYVTMGVLASGGVAAPGVAFAGGDATAAEVSSGVKAEARARFDAGLRLFEANDYPAALAEFKRAYDLIPNLVVMYNVGLVYAAMNRPVDAVDSLDLALANDGAQLSAQQRANARKARAEQAGRVAQVMIVTDRPAIIEIDGVEAGKTPLAKPLRVASGLHTIAVAATGFLPSRREVMFAGQVTETLTLALLPATSASAHLTISASPVGAELLVNGKSVGVAPLGASVAVDPGNVRVEARRAGYRTASQSVNVDDGASGTVDLVLEEDPSATDAPRGRLRLALAEPGAEISVDGAVKALGTDQTLQLPAGPHQLRVARAGFQPSERRVDVEAGKETSLTVTLAPTLETEAQREDSAHTRRLVGGAILGGGLLIAIGAGVYAVLTRNDVANSQATLDQRVLDEMNPNFMCYYGTDTAGHNKYIDLGCGAYKASLQDDVSNAKIRRDVAYGAVGLGVVAASIGTYLLVRSSGGESRGPSTSTIGFWSDGRNGGLLVSGRF